MTVLLSLQIIATVTGMVGTALLAHNGPRAGWGHVLYLVSNPAAIAFSWLAGNWWFLAMYSFFMVVAVWGVWRWLVKPFLDTPFLDVGDL